MKRLAVFAALMLALASCDAGTLNPEIFLPPPDGDSYDNQLDAACNLICARIKGCYPTRTDVHESCVVTCANSGFDFQSCRSCLDALSCTDIEAGACAGACTTGVENLTCGPTWSQTSADCDGQGCVCRPPCSDNGNLSLQCNSGCCINNQCAPMCACTSGYTVPTGC